MSFNKNILRKKQIVCTYRSLIRIYFTDLSRYNTGTDIEVVIKKISILIYKDTSIQHHYCQSKNKELDSFTFRTVNAHKNNTTNNGVYTVHIFYNFAFEVSLCIDGINVL